MILISHNLYRGNEIILPTNTVIRINLAWVKSLEEVEEYIKNCSFPIFLDFPMGRFKPPIPKLTLADVSKLLFNYPKIKYFAVSNAESPLKLGEIRDYVPKNIVIVPKIETENGVNSILTLVKLADTKLIMLDKDDLYNNVEDMDKYTELIDFLREICKKNGIKILELQGVVFKDV